MLIAGNTNSFKSCRAFGIRLTVRPSFKTPFVSSNNTVRIIQQYVVIISIYISPRKKNKLTCNLKSEAFKGSAQ